MNILITGATGFLGSHLARLLVSEGHRVYALVRPNGNRWRLNDIYSRLSIMEGDLAAVGQLERFLPGVSPDVCLHLAWRGLPGRSLQALDNIESLKWSVDLIRALPGIGCRRVAIVGTCWEYDTDYGYLTEATPAKPHDLYGASKHTLHLLADNIAAVRGIEVVWPRIFYLFGPQEDEHRLVPSIILALLRNQVAEITPGQQIRDYLHVKDVAAAIWAVAQSKLTGPINIASGSPVSVRQIALEIGEILAKPHLIGLGLLKYREGDPMFICGQIDLLKSKIGWSPNYDLHQGLCQTVEWWKAHSCN